VMIDSGGTKFLAHTGPLLDLQHRKERSPTYIGVRISCDILARNSDFVLLANSAASLAAVLR